MCIGPPRCSIDHKTSLPCVTNGRDSGSMAGQCPGRAGKGLWRDGKDPDVTGVDDIRRARWLHLEGPAARGASDQELVMSWCTSMWLSSETRCTTLCIVWRTSSDPPGLSADGWSREQAGVVPRPLCRTGPRSGRRSGRRASEKSTGRCSARHCPVRKPVLVRSCPPQPTELVLRSGDPASAAGAIGGRGCLHPTRRFREPG